MNSSGASCHRSGEPLGPRETRPKRSARKRSQSPEATTKTNRLCRGPSNQPRNLPARRPGTASGVPGQSARQFLSGSCMRRVAFKEPVSLWNAATLRQTGTAPANRQAESVRQPGEREPLQGSWPMPVQLAFFESVFAGSVAWEERDKSHSTGADSLGDVVARLEAGCSSDESTHVRHEVRDRWAPTEAKHLDQSLSARPVRRNDVDSPRQQVG